MYRRLHILDSILRTLDPRFQILLLGLGSHSMQGSRVAFHEFRISKPSSIGIWISDYLILGGMARTDTLYSPFFSLNPHNTLSIIKLWNMQLIYTAYHYNYFHFFVSVVFLPRYFLFFCSPLLASQGQAPHNGCDSKFWRHSYQNCPPYSEHVCNVRTQNTQYDKRGHEHASPFPHCQLTCNTKHNLWLHIAWNKDKIYNSRYTVFKSLKTVKMIHWWNLWTIKWWIQNIQIRKVEAKH